MTASQSEASPTVQEERSLRVEVKLYYDLYVPTDESENPRPLLITLHGYGASKRQMMREGRSIAPPEFAVASLQGFHQHLKEPREKGAPLRYGFGWLTNFHPEDSIAVHHRALLDLIDSLANEGLADPERIFLLGFSQSCALNYRFAFTHPEKLRGIVGICGGLPGDWDSSELYKPTGAAVLHLHGMKDEIYPPERVSNYKAQLSTRAHDVEVRGYEAGHEITQPMREDVQSWLRRQASK